MIRSISARSKITSDQSSDNCDDGFIIVSDGSGSDSDIEIVSTESILREAHKPPFSQYAAYKPSVFFEGVLDSYPADSCIVSKLTFTDGFQRSPTDRVILVPSGWRSVNEALCFGEIRKNHVKIIVQDLPKTPNDLFHLCYWSLDKEVPGVSSAFSIRDVLDVEKQIVPDVGPIGSRVSYLENFIWNSLNETEEAINVESDAKLEDPIMRSNEKIITEGSDEKSVTEDGNKKSVNEGSDEDSLTESSDADSTCESTDEESVAEGSTLPHPNMRRNSKRSHSDVLKMRSQKKKHEMIQAFADSMRGAILKNENPNTSNWAGLAARHMTLEKQEREDMFQEQVRQNKDLKEVRELQKSAKSAEMSLTKELLTRDQECSSYRIKISHLENKLAKSQNELLMTRDFVEYMVSQKDERFERMSPKDRDVHKYVYATMKSRFEQTLNNSTELVDPALKRNMGRLEPRDNVGRLIHKYEAEIRALEKLHGEKMELLKKYHEAEVQSLKKSHEEKEQDYATQLVSQKYQNEAFEKSQKILRDSYESRIKECAKEYAQLVRKYQKLLAASSATSSPNNSYFTDLRAKMKNMKIKSNKKEDSK